MKLHHILLSLIISILLLQSCSKENYSIENAIMRLPLGAGTNSAAFFTLTNNTDEDIKIVSASSTLDAKIEVHNVSMMNGMMHMHEVEFIEVGAHKSQEFKSGAYHIMMMGIKDQLKANDQVTITLELSSGESISFDATVTDLNAMKTDSMPMHH